MTTDESLLEALGRSDLVVPTAGEERPPRTRSATNRLLGVAYLALRDHQGASLDCVASNRIASAIGERLAEADAYIDETERPLEDELWP